MATFPFFDACTLFGPWPGHAGGLQFESLVATLSQNSIAQALVCSSSSVLYDARAGNDLALQAHEHSPNLLLPVAVLDPRAFPASLDELDERVAQGFRAVRFFPGEQNWPLRLAPFEDLLARCGELKLPVAVSVANHGDVSALGEVAGGLPVPVIVANISGEMLGEAIAVARRHANFHFETARLTAPRALEAFVAAVPNGEERLVFASYTPLRYISAALGPVLTSALSNEGKARVLGDNLRRLLGPAPVSAA
jgi:predicted TIM-barrel fold metal-dependent hydrolase